MAAPKHEVNVRMQGAIKFALEQVAQVRPLDPVTFVAEKLLEYDRQMDEKEQAHKLNKEGLFDEDYVPDNNFYLLGRSWDEEELVLAVRNAATKGELLEQVTASLGDDAAGFILVTLRGLRGHTLLQPVMEELSHLIVQSDITILTPLSVVASTHSELFETQTLVRAFAAASLCKDAEVRRQMGIALASAIASGRLEYEPSTHRSYASDPSLQGAFLCACCLQDHEWFLNNKLELLGDSPTTFLPMVATLCEGLTAMEIRQLQKELLSGDHGYSERAVAVLEAEMVQAANGAANKGELMRWGVDE